MHNYKISVIIGTRNRNKLLTKTLVSLSQQTIKKDLEVLVCDDGGNTNTEEVVKRFRNNLNISYYRCKDKEEYCWAQAKNLGARKAKSDFLLFMDDDILLPPASIETMYGWLTRFPSRKYKYFVTPKERLYIHDDFPSKMILNNYNNIANYNINNYSNGVTLGCTGLIYRDIFNKVQGFDEILFSGLQLGDTDITKRLQGFLNIRSKKLPIRTYHLDNDPFRTKRNILAIERKNIAKQLIQEKMKMLGFVFKNYDDDLKKDEKMNREGFYNEILSNKNKLDLISIKLRNRLALYDHPDNYYKPCIKKHD